MCQNYRTGFLIFGYVICLHWLSGCAGGDERHDNNDEHRANTEVFLNDALRRSVEEFIEYNVGSKRDIVLVELRAVSEQTRTYRYSVQRELRALIAPNIQFFVRLNGTCVAYRDYTDADSGMPVKDIVECLGNDFPGISADYRVYKKLMRAKVPDLESRMPFRWLIDSETIETKIKGDSIVSEMLLGGGSSKRPASRYPMLPALPPPLPPVSSDPE